MENTYEIEIITLKNNKIKFGGPLRDAGETSADLELGGDDLTLINSIMDGVNVLADNITFQGITLTNKDIACGQNYFCKENFFKLYTNVGGKNLTKFFTKYQDCEVGLNISKNKKGFVTTLSLDGESRMFGTAPQPTVYESLIDFRYDYDKHVKENKNDGFNPLHSYGSIKKTVRRPVKDDDYKDDTNFTR